MLTYVQVLVLYSFFAFHFVHSYNVSLQWEHLDLGTLIRSHGVIAGDFDNNGYPEVYVTANSLNDIMVIQFDGQDYAVKRKLPRPWDVPGKDIIIRHFAHLATAGDYGLRVSYYANKIFIYDLAAGKLVSEVVMLDSGISHHVGQMQLASLGVAYTVKDKLFFVYGDSSNGFFSKVYYNMGEGPAISGSFTEAYSQEIVYQDGSLYQYNSCSDSFIKLPGFPSPIVTRSNNWMVSLDVNGDGISEIIVHAEDRLECLSALDYSIFWKKKVGRYSVNPVITGDFDSDGDFDIIYGSSRYEKIYALDSKTGVEVGQIYDPENKYSFYTTLAIGDFDADGINEIAWAANFIGDFESTWFFQKPNSDTEEWRSSQWYRPYTKYAFDTFGQFPGFMFASGTADPGGHDNSAITYFDLSNKTEIWSQLISNNTNGRDINSVAMAGDLFGDGCGVIVVAKGGDIHFHSSRDGSLYKSVSTGESYVKTTVANVFDSDVEDIIVFGNAIHIISGHSLDRINVTSPEIGEIVDLAVGNTHGGKPKDVYALTKRPAILWRFDVDSGKLVQVISDGTTKAVASLSNCVFGFTDNVYYAMVTGNVRSIMDSSFDVQVCPPGEMVHLGSFSNSFLTFVCKFSFGALNSATGTIFMTHSLQENRPHFEQGELIGDNIDGTNYYLYGVYESIGLYS